MQDTHSHTLTSILQVVGANAAALGITFSQINEMLTALSLMLASAFTIYKFFKEIKSKK